jgi:NADH-quinone oxidoreductase subunit N
VLSLLTLVGCAVITYADFNAGTTVYTFNNMFVSDPMANLLKLFTYLAVGITLVYSRQYAGDRGMMSGNLGGEFYVLALFTMLGQMIMISGNNMLPIYLGLELMSLSLYALVALRRDHATSTEAAMKYFILGSLASGFMLYGISMIYGATGSLDITNRQAAAGPPPTTPSWCSAWCSWSPAWPSSWAPCRSTCGCRTSTRVRRPP